MKFTAENIEKVASAMIQDMPIEALVNLLSQHCDTNDLMIELELTIKHFIKNKMRTDIIFFQQCQREVDL